MLFIVVCNKRLGTTKQNLNRILIGVNKFFKQVKKTRS